MIWMHKATAHLAGRRRQIDPTRGCGRNPGIQTSQAFTQVGRRRGPEPVLTYEPASTGRINDMGQTSIGRSVIQEHSWYHPNPKS